MSICSDKYWETQVIAIFFANNDKIINFDVKVFTHNLDKNIYHFPRI